MRYVSLFLITFAASILFAEQPEVRGIKVVAKDVKSGGLHELHLYDRMFALVIGIDHYANSDINLKYAVNDARAVAEVLEKEFRFEKVLTLYNEQATQAGIVQKIHELSKMTYDNDAVLIFFAGHGTEVEGRERKSIGYLIPHDGGFEEQKDSFARNVSMNTIVSDWSNLIKAKHLFYVMDACYSGLMASTRAVGVRPVMREYEYLKEMTREPVRIVLTAGTAGQQVLDGGKGGHSVFTSRFIEALRSQKDFVTGLEVAAQIKRKVMADASARGHTQTPDYARLFGLGDFVFVPQEESLESLKANLAAVQRSIEEKGKVRDAKLLRQQADIQERLAASRHREMILEKIRVDTERRAAEEAERRREIAEMQRKLSEARAHEAVARAKYMTITAAVSEVENILERIRETEADIDKDYEPLLAKLGAPKDPFEKTTAYRKRIDRRTRLVNEEIPQAKHKRIDGFKKALEVLNGNEFLVERSEVKLNLASRLYDADNEVYHVEISTAEQREPQKLALPVPTDEARKLYTAWKSQVLIYRVYARLELPADLGKGKIASPIARAELRLPNSENPYLLSLEKKISVVLKQAFPGFEIPITSKDAYGNPVRKGNDPNSGLSLEIRQKATGMHFVLCPSGSFMMGSKDDDEKPVHKVTLPKPFYMGKYEVTQAEWKKILGKSPSHFDGINNPVEEVSWDDSQEFLKKLSVTEMKFSLPTESQWEYACRAGTTTKFSSGNQDNDLNDHAWYSSNADRKTHPVGSKKPNPWGIYDMHGNVLEWCQDWYGNYPSKTIVDPMGPTTGEDRVIRGGGWYNSARYCRAANRGGGGPGDRNDNLGFRLALPSVQQVRK